jgi:hypothetical protein
MALARLKCPAVVGTILLMAAGLPGLHAQVTETPVTMAPGSILMRMDAISLGFEPDSTAPNQYRALALGTTLVSAGLTDSVDFEAGTQLFLRDTFNTSGMNQTQSGIGDFTFRTKWTFWKDPSSGEEAAIIPYIVVPVNSSAVGNDSFEGGLILPWARDLGGGFRTEAMAEWDEFRNVSNTRYDARWFGSADAKWDFGGMIGAYAEVTLSLSTAGGSSDTGTLGGGATLSVSKNFQWDFEVSKVIGQGENAWTEVLRFRWKIL